MKNNYSHFYNKGFNGQTIFFSKSDYFMLLDLMHKYCCRYNITMVAYCLIPNHYHFLLRQDGEVSDSKYVQTVFNSFVQKINKKYNREGTIFKGRAQSRAVETEAYLYHLCRYIHANPVKHGLVKAPTDWLYSNYREYLQIRKGNLYDSSFFDNVFENPNDYENWVNEYIESIFDSHSKPDPNYTDLYLE